jgi:hypothetical protein
MLIAIEIASAIVAFVVTVMLASVLPPVAQCPRGWNLQEGVRRDGPDVGEFACYAPLPPCCGEPAGKLECQRQCPAVDRFHSRIYCTGGAKPIIVDERTVGCQR